MIRKRLTLDVETDGENGGGGGAEDQPLLPTGADEPDVGANGRCVPQKNEVVCAQDPRLDSFWRSRW
jgi:hypothetical protein